ncbi:MAG TPA: amidohydrolase family protein [Myxococcaceae bacterium]|nr:amidohydrolase family protein [Myxococcaceae bacterium]
MSYQKKGFREDDSWFSEQDLGKLEPADHADLLRSPVPTQMVSNGEYLPYPQTEKQKRVEARLVELADAASRKLGISRRQFLASSGGMAAAFVAMNDVFGKFFNVHPAEMFEPAAFAANAPPRNLFVLDTQLHIIRSSRQGPGNALRAIAQGLPNSFNPNGLPDETGGVNTPWNPALAGLPNLNENFHLVQFMKDVYLDSQVTVGIMSNNTSAAVPEEGGGTRPPRNIAESEAGEFLTAPQTLATRDWVNRIAGSTRMLGHGQLFPGIEGTENLQFMQWQIDELKPDSWKGYNVANSAKDSLDPEAPMRRWRMDDEQVAYPMYELITRNRHMLKTHPGFFNICIHKGLRTGALPLAEIGHPADIPKAARDWPDLNFIYYHSCIRPGFWVLDSLNEVNSGAEREGVPDILWTTEMAVLSAPFRNVYAELGTTFASTVITFPSVCAHILGQLLKFMGEDHVVFGSDSVWYGSPQWQIEAFWRFQIPEEMRKQWGYPQLTEGAKRKILGLNSARMYRLPPAAEVAPGAVYKPVPQTYEQLIPDSLKTILEFPGYVGDNFSKARKAYYAAGATPSNTRYGWLRKRA